MSDTLYAQIEGFDVAITLKEHIRDILGHHYNCSYTVTTPTGVIFNGDQFSPTPRYGWDSWQSVCELVFWICVTPDSGADLSHYSPEQLEWAKSDHCEIASSVFWSEELLNGECEVDPENLIESDLGNNLWSLYAITYTIEEEEIVIPLRMRRGHYCAAPAHGLSWSTERLEETYRGA